MAKSIRLDFACKQRLSDFGPGETGFCRQCQTKVHDLTLLSTSEIKEMINRHQGQLCGRIFSDQMEERPDSGWSLKLNLLTSALAGFLFFAGNKLSAQRADTVKTEQHMASNASAKTLYVDSSPADSAACQAAGDLADKEKNFREQRFQYMRIGRRRFYIGWRFPFFTTRKYLMGKFRH